MSTIVNSLAIFVFYDSILLAVLPRSGCLNRKAFLHLLGNRNPVRCNQRLRQKLTSSNLRLMSLGAIRGNKDRKNLFKQQLDDYVDVGASTVQQRDVERWQDIVMEEAAKNRNDDPSENFLFGEHNLDTPRISNVVDSTTKIRDIPFNYRLSPEGRMKLENRITHLKQMAASNPGGSKPVHPTLWIIRSSFGNYCELLERDEERLESFVKAVRSHFSRDQLKILKMKIDIRMPLCEIFFEGDITDLVRIFYARGGTLQFYVVPRFWTRCELLEKDPRLEAKYGKATAPGLFPQWDEEGMIEELIDCMDIRPDYALEFRVPNAWHLLPMVPERDRDIMVTLFENVHWPTRLRVQKAFEQGIADYRDVISEEYKSLQRSDRSKSNILDYWLPPI